MAIGKRVLKEYRYDGGVAVITVLEGEEVLVAVDPLDACMSTQDLHDLADWLNEKATEISTKFATGEFS